MLAAETAGPHRTLHFHLDHLGTPRLITNHTGAVVSEHAYFPFGEEATSTAQHAEKKKFTGHERNNSHLDYMHARYYSVDWSRFLSGDQFDDTDYSQPGSWNKYSYVRNDPVNGTDPTGQYVVTTGQDYTFTLVTEVIAHDPGPSVSMAFWLGRRSAVQQLDRWQSSISAWSQRWGDILEFAGRTLSRDCESRAECQDSFLSVAGVYGGTGRAKAINLPAWRTVTIDMTHIMSRHTIGGAQTSARATKFIGMTEQQIKRLVRQAYRNGQAVESQGDRVRVVGQAGGLTIEMWSIKRRV